MTAQDTEPVSKENSVALTRARAARRNAARTAARARRTWLSLLFFPIFGIFLILDLFRDIRDHITRNRATARKLFPTFHRPAAMPPPEKRSVREITDHIKQIPFEPVSLPTTLAFLRDNGPDALGSLLSNNPKLAALPHRYPQPFRDRLFTGHDGRSIAGIQAMHDHRGPAVVICHGLLMTKNFDAIIRIARRAFEAWGFHVVALDLRGWGDSSWTSDAPASAGLFEGRDIIEVCRELHRDELVTSVAAIGYSLGGASVLNAAHISSLAEDTPLDGGAITVSAPTDIREALRHISTKPHWRDPFYGLFQLFRAYIKDTVRRRGMEPTARTWEDLVAQVSAPYYEMSIEEICERASAINFADEINQPVLDLHSVDDFVVPVEHAYLLRDAASNNPNVQVIIKNVGAHVSFSAVDSRWYHSVIRQWLEYWATPGSEHPKSMNLGIDEAEIGG